MINQSLPDISQTQQPNDSSPLAWVGMQGIYLPLKLEQSTGTYPIQCKVNATVNLPRADIKGIHMSRLYQHCNQLHQLNTLEISQLLQKMITSHQDCGSSAAQFDCQFELLLQRHALSSPELSGWKAYPVKLHAELENGKFRLELGVEVSYSSTCPCSAALSRQIIHDAFLADYSKDRNINTQQVAEGLLRKASLATPHSQRSLAQVTIRHHSTTQDLKIVELIDLVEETLQTATQTAVKQIDEQTFAKRNGENLMFVEDAARRLNHALAQDYTDWSLKVDHQESLHPHNAVAYQHSEHWLTNI